jgi:predicted Rossmann fold flavoprotein
LPERQFARSKTVDIAFSEHLRPECLDYTAAVAEQTDIAIIGGGAAGLMAAIWAGRTTRAACADRAVAAEKQAPCIVVLDGAKSLGAKILVAGGGRCNVTHDVVDERAFAGSSRNAIKKVLRRFDVPHTIRFFEELGVELKREDTGKLFPITDRARTVLEALLDAARVEGVEIRNPWRVESVRRLPAPLSVSGGGVGAANQAARDAQVTHPFIIAGASGELQARAVVLATGGRSLPKTGSDGLGYLIARGLGHSITPRVFPALVPLTLPRDHWICALSGVAVPAALEVRSGSGKKLQTFTDSTLCTHFGLSGPAPLDISRYYADAKLDDPSAQLVINWLPEQTLESVDAALLELGKVSSGRWLREQGLPDRLAKVLCEQAQVDPSAPAHQLTRDRRRALASLIAQTVAPVTGDRGYTYAEVTAGGVPLSELRLETMESRVCPGLHIIGELCDVDGRIGGYNFQWAWASGFVCGQAVANEMIDSIS